MVGIDLIIERRYADGGRIFVERVTWQHVSDPEVRWRFKPRRFRKPKLVEVDSGIQPDPRGRPLPEWCAPDYPPNRWLWIRAAQPAADLASVEPDRVVEGTPIYGPESPWWDYYAIPLRAGVVLR